MKFRFYIANTFDGLIEGTNDEEKAKELAACTEFFVVDAHSGTWLTDDGEVDVQERA